MTFKRRRSDHRILVKRIYDAPGLSDGARVLVERLWPRGITKERAAIRLWLKDAAPSHVLRRWFGHEPDRWAEFRRRYAAELRSHPGALAPLFDLLQTGDVTFVYAARDERYNNARALKAYVERRRKA